MRPETVRNKLRKMALDSCTRPTGESHVCAKCGEPVAVPDGMEFEDGDWCYVCWADWGANVRPLLQRFFGMGLGVKND